MGACRVFGTPRQIRKDLKMSQIKSIIRCPVCEVEIAEGARVCFACGHLLDAPAGAEQSVEKNEAPITDLQTDEEVQEPTVSPPPPAKKPESDEEFVDAIMGASGVWQFFTSRLIKRAAVFMVALVMFLLTMAAPMSRSYMTDEVVGEYSIGFTTVDSIQLAMYATDKYSDRQLQRTAEYKEYTKLSEQLLNFNPKLSEVSELSLVKDMSRLSLQLALMNKSVSLDFDMTVAAIVSFLLILAATAFFFTALASLAFEVIRLFFGFNIKLDGYKASVILLWISVMILPLCGYAHAGLACFGVGDKLGGFSSAGSGLSTGFVFACIVGIAGVVYTALSALLPKIKKYGFKMSARAKSGAISAAVALVMLVSLLSPMISVRIANPERPSEIDSYAMSASELYYTTGADISHYSKTTSRSNTDKITTAISDAFDEGITASTNEILNDLITGVNRRDNSGLYLAIQIFTFISLSLILLFLFSLGRKYILGHKCDGAVKGFRILSMLATLVSAILAISLFFVAKGAITEELSYILTFALGAGPVLLVVLSVAMGFTFKVSESKYQGIEYDDPDVSYSPYVITARKKKRY